jgi:hypothetical protein
MRIPRSSNIQQNCLCKLTDYLLWLCPQEEKLGEQVANPSKHLIIKYFEQVINGLVIELFFIYDLLPNKINLFKHIEEARLPILADIPEKQRLSRLEEIYGQISNDRHPIRGCLESLKSLEVVRIIEERK